MNDDYFPLSSTSPHGASEIQALLAPEEVAEGEVSLIHEVYAKDKKPPIYRQSKTYPKKLLGGGFKPRTHELEFPFDQFKLQNSGEFRRSLNPFELALNAAKQEPNFRLADFIREFNENNPQGWISLPEGRRRQTAFNQKLAAWKQAGGDPRKLAPPDEARDDQLPEAAD